MSELEGVVELVVARGQNVELWALPAEEPRKTLTFEEKTSPSEVFLTRAASGVFACAHHRTECLLFTQSLDLLTRLKAPSLHACGFLGDHLFCVERVSDEYKVSLRQAKGSQVTCVVEGLTGRLPKPPMRFVAMEGATLVHCSASNKLDVYQQEAEKFTLCQSLTTGFALSNFVFTSGKILALSNDTATAEVFALAEGKYVSRTQRVFNNVQELYPHWKGDLLLIQAHRYNDSSNKSYYGLEKIFGFNDVKGLLEMLPTQRGVIHDCGFNHQGTQFVLVSGKMPARTLVYNKDRRPFFLLNHGYRNTVRYSPNDRFIALAGLGSLNGDIDVFCAESFRLVGHCKSAHSSFVKWSPDSRFFLTAIVMRKLKVDHLISLYSVDCRLLRKFKLPVFDLADADFLSATANAPFHPNYLPHATNSGGLLNAQLEEPHELTPEEVKKFFEIAARPARATEEAKSGEEGKPAPEKPSKLSMAGKVLTRRLE